MTGIIQKNCDYSKKIKGTFPKAYTPLLPLFGLQESM